MNEKEMRALFESARRLWLSETSAWEGFKAACELMMGKAEPFMYAISHEGKAYFDENCVSPDAEGLEYEVDSLNDANDGGFSVIPLYTAPPMQNTEREIVLPEFKGAVFQNKDKLTDREILKKLLEEYARAAVLLDRKGRS